MCGATTRLLSGNDLQAHEFFLALLQLLLQSVVNYCKLLNLNFQLFLDFLRQLSALLCADLRALSVEAFPSESYPKKKNTISSPIIGLFIIQKGFLTLQLLRRSDYNCFVTKKCMLQTIFRFHLECRLNLQVLRAKLQLQQTIFQQSF